ncbi:MAG TPA: hypothetical protein VFZ11_07315 [Gemmatimonadaceae bacterium]
MSRRLVLAAAALALALTACSSPTAPAGSTPTANLTCGGGHTSGSGTRC